MMVHGIRAAIVLLFAFALGMLAGMTFERHHAIHAPGGLSAAEVHEAAIAELEDALDLDDRQVEQIHAVMAAHQEVVQQVWEQLRPEVTTAMQEVHAQIAELLRPEQRRRYHDWLMQRLHQSQEPDPPSPPR